jgi:hypothetical protein
MTAPNFKLINRDPYAALVFQLLQQPPQITTEIHT